VVLEKENEVISEFLRAIGPWRNYVMIGGGYALIIYKPLSPFRSVFDRLRSARLPGLSPHP
jgi:hypothetical protein